MMCIRAVRKDLRPQWCNLTNQTISFMLVAPYEWGRVQST